jgi:hypothetical protein
MIARCVPLVGRFEPRRSRERAPADRLSIGSMTRIGQKEWLRVIVGRNVHHIAHPVRILSRRTANAVNL